MFVQICKLPTPPHHPQPGAQEIGGGGGLREELVNKIKIKNNKIKKGQGGVRWAIGLSVLKKR